MIGVAGSVDVDRERPPGAVPVTLLIHKHIGAKALRSSVAFRPRQGLRDALAAAWPFQGAPDLDKWEQALYKGLVEVGCISKERSLRDGLDNVAGNVPVTVRRHN